MTKAQLLAALQALRVKFQVNLFASSLIDVKPQAPETSQHLSKLLRVLLHLSTL